MAIVTDEYPYISEDKNGKWKHYSKTFKILIEPSDFYIQNNPEIIIEEEPTDIEILQNENNILKAKIQALTESNQFLEDCIVEMAEVVYA